MALQNPGDIGMVLAMFFIPQKWQGIGAYRYRPFRAQNVLFVP
jgi:hypothetical protein